MALVAMIEAGHGDAAFNLLEQNPDLANEPDACLKALYRGFSALAAAIADRKESLTPFEAAALGRTELIDGSSVVEFNSDGWQPLHLAAFFGRLETTKRLIRARAPLNELSRNDLQVAPIHSALANGHEAVARELVFEGAELGIMSGAGWTPLHYAAFLGSRSLVQFLLEHGAIPVEGPEGKFPDQIAEDRGFSEVSAILSS